MATCYEYLNLISSLHAHFVVFNRMVCTIDSSSIDMYLFHIIVGLVETEGFAACVLPATVLGYIKVGVYVDETVLVCIVGRRTQAGSCSSHVISVCIATYFVEAGLTTLAGIFSCVCKRHTSGRIVVASTIFLASGNDIPQTTSTRWISVLITMTLTFTRIGK